LRCLLIRTQWTLIQHIVAESLFRSAPGDEELEQPFCRGVLEGLQKIKYRIEIFLRKTRMLKKNLSVLFLIGIFSLPSISLATSNYLNTYSSDLYNSLKSPETADMRLKRNPNFEKFLAEAMEAIDKFQVPVGFRLVHRHHDVPQQGAVVESFNSNFNGKPALISEVKASAEGAFPASWIVLGNPQKFQLRVFEYSTDLAVKETFEQLQQEHAPLIEYLSRLIIEYKLNDVIALSIAVRSPVQLQNVDHMMEIQFGDQNMSVLVPYTDELNASSNTIRTAWGPKQVSCIATMSCNPGMYPIHYSKPDHYNNGT
jgi:hypothetical protein